MLSTVNKFRPFSVWSVLCGLGHPMTCYRRLSAFIRTRKHKYCTLWLMLRLSSLKITSWHTFLVSIQHSVRLFFSFFSTSPCPFQSKAANQRLWAERHKQQTTLIKQAKLFSQSRTKTMPCYGCGKKTFKKSKRWAEWSNVGLCGCAHA